jgi:hypothetical protein
MAKVTIENTREHDIILAAQSTTVTVPAARPNDNPDAKDKTIPGSIVMDDSFLKEAQKSDVVKYYFSDGWLRQGQGKSPAAPVEEKKPAPPAR